MSIEQKEETENSKKLLNRKTKRENNNNNNESSNNPQLPIKNEIMCSICLEYQRFSTKCYKCIVCNSYFHLDCYNLFIFSENEKDYIKEDDVNLDIFKCSRCKEEEKNGNNTKITCHLCVEHNGILKHLKDNLYIHHYCYVFFKDKIHQNKGGKGGKCNNCKIKNIPIFKCESTGCKNKFHIKCALEKGLIFSLAFLHDNQKNRFDEKIPFFCEVHGKESIISYFQYMTAIAQSMDDKKGEPDSKPLKVLQNENEKINNDLNISSKKDKENNNDNANANNQKNEENEKEKPINSISSNSIHGDNYGSNISEEASEKTPVNHYHTKEKDNSISSNNNLISNDNNNSNKNENNDVINSNENRNNESKKEIDTLNNENNENNEEEVDITVLEDEKNENKNENSNNGNNSKNDIEDFISSENKEKENMDIDSNEGEKELEEYKPPEIKYEIIDLFENFNNMNKDYCFPGSFFKFKNIC